METILFFVRHIILLWIFGCITIGVREGVGFLGALLKGLERVWILGCIDIGVRKGIGILV